MFLHNMDNYQEIKAELYQKLLEAHAFWSYDISNRKSIPDEILIEKTIVYLGHEELQMLFKIFKKKYIKKVWRERLAIAGDYYKNINYMMAHIYFEIKDPNKYMKTAFTIHLKKMTGQYEKNYIP